MNCNQGLQQKNRPQNAHFHKSHSIFQHAKNFIDLGNFSCIYAVPGTYSAGESDQRSLNVHFKYRLYEIQVFKYPRNPHKVCLKNIKYILHKMNRNITKQILVALPWKKVAGTHLLEQETPGGELLRSFPT